MYPKITRRSTSSPYLFRLREFTAHRGSATNEATVFQVITTIEYRSPSIARYHRLAVRHERQVEIHEALLHLRYFLICLNYLS